MVREKKKRYGISRLSKEENQRLKLRTEDRMMIARAKENLWKRFREKEGVKEIEEEELNAWKDVQSMVIELEEEGSWRNPRTNIREIQIRKGKLKVEEIAKKEVAKKVDEGSKEEVTKKEVAREKKAMKEGTKNATEKEVPRRAKMTRSLGTERTELDMIRERILKKEKKEKSIEPILTELEMTRRKIIQKEILRSGGQEEKAKMIRTEETGIVGVMVRKRKVELESQVEAVVHLRRAGGQGEGVDEGSHGGGEEADNWELKPRLKQITSMMNFIQENTINNKGDIMGMDLEGEGDTGTGGSRIYRFLLHSYTYFIYLIAEI